MIAVVEYVQEDLAVEGDDVRFVAQVRVSLKPAGSDEVLMSGSIQRLHSVHAGEYMHVGNASISFLDAFRDMVQELPVRDIQN